MEDGKESRKEKAMGIQSYRELEVWRLSMDLAVECYRLTKGFPNEELFGMTSQIRRAAAGAWRRGPTRLRMVLPQRLVPPLARRLARAPGRGQRRGHLTRRHDRGLSKL